MHHIFGYQFWFVTGKSCLFQMEVKLAARRLCADFPDYRPSAIKILAQADKVSMVTRLEANNKRIPLFTTLCHHR